MDKDINRKKTLSENGYPNESASLESELADISAIIEPELFLHCDELYSTPNTLKETLSYLKDEEFIIKMDFIGGQCHGWKEL